MSFIPLNIEDYIRKHLEPESPELSDIQRDTYLNVLNPGMLSGHYQGRLLSFFSYLMRPKNILEIGTYTGYSAICLAEGLAEGGRLTTIEINPERYEIIKRNIAKSSFSDKIIPLLGNALEVIPKLNPTIDLVFIDADKANYMAYFNLIIQKMRPGGLIITDNVLWHGKVAQQINPKDLDTLSLNHYNEKLSTDSRLHSIILPVRDGIMLSFVK